MATMPAETTAADQAAAKNAALARRWISEVGQSESNQQKFIARVRKIEKLYKQQRAERDSKRKYALLWSNTQTVLPAIYSRPPEPVVTRRYKDEDPIGRQASEILERSLSYSIDAQGFDGMLRACTFDFVLAARSQAWERYVPTYGETVTEKVKVLQITTDAGMCYADDEGQQYDPKDVSEEDGEQYASRSYRPVVFEQSVTDFLNIEDFGHSPSRTWDEVSYVWRRVFMSRAQLKERFGEDLGQRIPLDFPAKRMGTPADESDLSRKAAIYEVWDKTTREAIWISKGYGEAPLDRRPDPLKLEGFFPCPRPLFGTMTNDSLIPVPDYALYQDQAEEIDTLTAKIGELQDALKVVGLYAGEGKQDLNQLLKAPNTMLVPVNEWKSLKDDGGIGGRVEWWPIGQVVQALKAAIELRNQLIEDVFQITGVADIMRGASDPNETYGAQALKATWGSVRVRDRQKEVARFARDLIRLKGEVISELFSPETLAAMSGVKLPTNADKAQLQQQIAIRGVQAQMLAQQQPQQMGHNGGPPMAPEPTPEEQMVLQTPSWEDVMTLLRDDGKRAFRIDIETDSTIEPDEQMEKAQTVEFMQAIGNMIQTWGPAIQAAPELAPMAAAFIKFGARKFRAGRELESIIDQTMDQIAKKPPQQPGAGEAQQAPPPDRTPVEVQQLKNQQEQIKQQGETQRAQMDAQLEVGDQQLRADEHRLKLVVGSRDTTPQVQV